jgi:hypothetical protein
LGYPDFLTIKSEGMTDAYLLEQLVRIGRAMRKAQEDFRKAPGNPKEDKIKSAYLDERVRREIDFDTLLKSIDTIRPKTGTSFDS